MEEEWLCSLLHLLSSVRKAQTAKALPWKHRRWGTIPRLTTAGVTFFRGNDRIPVRSLRNPGSREASSGHEEG